jgi:spore coat polysaccharide biosynthesis predicted glycosyltransferase SpsG
VHNFLESEDFAQKMASAKVSITASGNTLFERVAYGVPGLSVAQFPRQDRIGWAFQNMGLTKHLGLGTEVEPRRLIGALHHLINDQYEMQAQIAATSDISMRSGAAEIVNAVQDLIT